MTASQRKAYLDTLAVQGPCRQTVVEGLLPAPQFCRVLGTGKPGVKSVDLFRIQKAGWHIWFKQSLPILKIGNWRLSPHKHRQMGCVQVFLVSENVGCTLAGDARMLHLLIISSLQVTLCPLVALLFLSNEITPPHNNNIWLNWVWKSWLILQNPPKSYLFINPGTTSVTPKEQEVVNLPKLHELTCVP